MTTPDLWAAAHRRIDDMKRAQSAWEDHPCPETGRSLHKALSDAAQAVHRLYHQPVRPTATGCPRHPTGPVDHAGLDSGEGPCMRCNQERRRAAATAENSPRHQLPRRRPLGDRRIPGQRTDEERP